jgi:uncharacterized oligopeptide transporter (OPT) family protein
MVIVATMGSAGGSLGFISNFYAAKVMATGVSYTFLEMAGFGIVSSLVGMAFVVPLRELLIVHDNLPWPGSKATAGVITALVEDGDPKQPKYLLGFGLIALTWVIGNDDGGFGWFPSGTTIDVFGLGAYGAAIAWSPFAIGGAYLMGFRTCVGFFFGGVGLLLMAPYLDTPATPHQYVWPGIGFLVATGLTMMAINWRVIMQAMASIAGLRRDAGDGDDDPVIPGRVYVVFSLSAFVNAALFLWIVMDINLLLIAMLIAIGGFLQNVIATRAAAQTAFNPARVMGILLQGMSAMLGGARADINLAGAGMVAGSGAQAGNLTGDMAYGRWFRVPSRWQFWAQLGTVIPCTLVSAWVFEKIQATTTLSLDGGDMPAPVAKMWAASALVFDGTTPMPPFAVEAMLIAGAVGIVYVLLESRPQIERFLPSSLGLGLGLVLPIAYDWAFFLGGVVLWIGFGRLLKVRDLTLTTVAVACIVAEGLGGVTKPVLEMLGIL